MITANINVKNALSQLLNNKPLTRTRLSVAKQKWKSWEEKQTHKLQTT